MEIKVVNENILNHKSELIIFGLFEKEQLGKDLKLVDGVLENQISQLLKNKYFEGEAGQTKTIYTLGKLPSKAILIVGLGKKNEFTTEKLRKTSASLAKGLREAGFKSFTTTLQSKEIVKQEIGQKTQVLIEGIMLGLYNFKKYITVDKDKIKKIKSITVLSDDVKAVIEGVKKGKLLSENVNYVRDLINEPAEIVTPEYLANEAKKIAKSSNGKIKVKVFGKSEIKKMNMGGLLGVAKGSNKEPKFVVMEYGNVKNKPIVFVGKGITFDSGGLDIKPAQHMEDMRSDMAGAATVMGTIKCISEMGLKKGVVAIFGACENMTGGAAFKQGDVLTTYNGKTIEIWHTDAEGRLTLADSLGYAEKNYKSDAIIDIATLTGASIIALGYEIVPLVSNNKSLSTKLLDAAEKVDEMTWELPLYEEYNDLIKGSYADVRNMSKEAYGPGVITAGLFLQNFIDKAHWAHLDVGAAGWTTSDKPYKPKGGNGICLRTFVKLVENWK